tara:strand:- start:1771 stop:2418 length:648 start_codon:yes stop_codon:yes gene_type:complete
MANQEFSGFVHDDKGVAIASADVELYDRNTTTPVRASTTTNASGYWTISHATEGRFDVKISKNSWVRWVKYDDEMQLETIEAKNLHIRGSDNAFDAKLAAPAWGADRTLTFRDATGTIFVGNYGYATVASDGTLQANSFNVTSITKGGTGNYTVTWATDFGNANYACVAICEAGNHSPIILGNLYAGTAQVVTFDESDPAQQADRAFHIIAIGDQ